MINIVVNGLKEEISVQSIYNYLISKDIKPQMVVVEHNEDIIDRQRWDDVILGENDILEIIKFVGGG